MPRGTFNRAKLQSARPFRMDPKKASEVERQIAEADEEFEEIRVNFRWGKEQLDLVKRAAKMIGVPYQTYIKQVVFKQCLADLKAAAEAVDKQGT